MTLAGVALWSGQPRRLWSAEKSLNVPFGFSLYGMKTLTLSEGLAHCAKLGYDCVELPVMPDWPADPKRLQAEDRRELRQRLEDSGLSLASIMENLPLLAANADQMALKDRLKAALELGVELSPQKHPVFETVLGGATTDWPASRNRLVELLSAWAEIGATHQGVIAIKAHINNALQSPEAAVEVVREVKSPWLKLVYDFSHFQRQGRDMEETLKLMAPHVAFVHVKDNVQREGKTEFALPGTGDQSPNYVRMLELLRELKYAGVVMVEVSAQVWGKPDYDPRAAATHCYETLHPAFIL